MERGNKKDVEDDGRIRFKKIGGGSLRFNGKIIKPNQIFKAHPDQIPKTFRNVVIPLDELPEDQRQPPAPIKVKKSEYSLQPHGKSKSLFDVVDKNGKVINQNGLKEEIANKLINDLQK